MKPIRNCSLYASIAFLTLSILTPARADKAWISPTDGLWRIGTNWSGGSPPDSTFSSNITTVWITNAISKVVTIDAGTPSTNLTVGRLNLWAASSFTNTLMMLDVGTNNPLALLSPLTIGRGGALSMMNSAVVVQDALTIS